MVWAWGQNAHGQLGDGTTDERTAPVQVQGLEDVTAIAAHDRNTLALRGDGTVWAWGDNGRGQLGDGTISYAAAPVQVQNLDSVTAIAAGWGHALALRSDGTVWAWGRPQMGYPPTQPPPTPAELAPRKIALGKAIAVAAGSVTAAAICEDGTVWTWENDDEIPAQVPGLSGVTALAIGANHALALKSDSTLWAWGNNKFGQLGDGTTTGQPEPMQVPDCANVTAIAAHDHSIALKSDGVVWAWGSNEKGQLGNGLGGLESSATMPGQVLSPFQRGLLHENVLNLYDMHPWWRRMCAFLQFVFRYFLFGWIWM
jgi:alpha-tubulin suppressor-like RCC1 family protein